jgi:hypothetical protein
MDATTTDLGALGRQAGELIRDGETGRHGPPGAPRGRREMYKFEVRYVGAPYGEGEAGHVVSRHRTREAAERALFRLTHVRECWDGRWRWVPTTGVLSHRIVSIG